MKRFLTSLFSALAAALLLSNCQSMSKSTGSIESKPWGKSKDGSPVTLYTLRNKAGIEIEIANYGGTVVSIKTPDKNGKMGDVVLGFDSIDGYLTSSPFFGCITGRYANRIALGKFTLEGKEYQLATNNPPNHLHGGKVGFDKKVWKGTTGPGASVRFTHTSPDGDEGYPGNLSMAVVYTLTDDNALRIDYTATTDKTTVLNLTNHSYFNLSADPSTTILDHVAVLHADKFTLTDDTMIPTGELATVEGTPMDFRQPHAIGERIEADYKPLKQGAGYDHNYIINGSGLALAAKVMDPKSGRTLTVHTTEPGVQLYTGNFLDGKVAGKGGVKIPRRGAFCLETQHFPDSPNQPSFPTTVLKPGETYQQTCVYKFGVE